MKLALLDFVDLIRDALDKLERVHVAVDQVQGVGLGLSRQELLVLVPGHVGGEAAAVRGPVLAVEEQLGVQCQLGLLLVSITD